MPCFPPDQRRQLRHRRCEQLWPTNLLAPGEAFTFLTGLSTQGEVEWPTLEAWALRRTFQIPFLFLSLAVTQQVLQPCRTQSNNFFKSIFLRTWNTFELGTVTSALTKTSDLTSELQLANVFIFQVLRIHLSSFLTFSVKCTVNHPDAALSAGCSCQALHFPKLGSMGGTEKTKL